MASDPFIRAGGVTDTGLVRKANEDAMLALPEAGVFGVADGMGGAAGGAFASENLLAAVSAAAGSLDSSSALDVRILRLREAVASSNQAIRAWAESQGVSGTGTTLILLTFDPRRPEFAALLHAGDSRAYLWRDGALRQLTRDHSAAESFGDGTEASIPAMFRNVVTNAIGMNAEVQLDETLVSLRSGDTVLLCSDGLYRMVADPQLAALMSESAPSPQLRAQALVRAANGNGGRDNITAVVVEIGVSAEGTRHGTGDSDTHDTDMRSALEAARQRRASETSASHPLTAEFPGTAESTSVSVSPVQTVTSSGGRRILLAVLSLLVVAAIIAYVGLRRPEAEPASQSESSAPAEAPVVPPPNEPVEEMLPVAELVRRGFERGDWNFPSDRLVAGVEGVDEDAFDAARAWMDEWRRAQALPAEARLYHEGYRTDVQAIVSVWNPAFAAPAIPDWSGDPAASATEFCHAQSRLQEAFFEELDLYVSSVAQVMGSLGKNPAKAENLLRSASGRDVAQPPALAGQVDSLRSLVRSLNRWKERSRRLPVGASELRNVTGTFLEPVEGGVRQVFAEVGTYAAAIAETTPPEGAREPVREVLALCVSYAGAIEDHAHINGLERENLSRLIRELVTSAGLRDLAEMRSAAQGVSP